jgi:excinuclease ABC subunit C
VFSEFGGTDFFHSAPTLQSFDLSREPKQVRQQIRSNCPRDPGVYGMIDRYGYLIYVGMSAHLQDRLLTYFTKGPPNAKEQRVAERSHRLVWEVGGHEFFVRLRELELIRRWRPQFNARGRPERKKIGYIFVTGGEAPRFRAGTLPPKASRLVWGPVRLSRRLRGAVDRLNHVFKLRDCRQEMPIRYAGQQTLFPDDRHAECMRGPLNTCLAPCAEGCTHQQYGQQIDAARALLDGDDASKIDNLKREMDAAAAQFDFERAARLRDAWTDLAYLSEYVDSMRSVRRDYWFVYPVPCHTGATVWMVVAGGTIVEALLQPDSEISANRCLGSLETIDHRGELKYRVEDFDQMQVTASWFRQHPHEMAKVLQPAQAVERCRSYLRL